MTFDNNASTLPRSLTTRFVRRVRCISGQAQLLHTNNADNLSCTSSPDTGALALTYSISSWHLDMTKGTLSLAFPVDMQVKTLNASALILQSSAAAAPAAE